MRIYRTKVGAADATQHLIATLTTPNLTYDDSIADAAILAAAVPTVNTTGTTLTLGGNPVGTNDAANKGYVDSTVSSSVSAGVAPKFDGTTGHGHTGVNGDGPQITQTGIAPGAITLGKLAPELEKRFDHITDSFVLGNNDWSALGYGQVLAGGSIAYSASDRGMLFSGISAGGQWTKLRVRMPVDPESTYVVRAKFTKKSGNGVIYIGAESLDGSYVGIATDQANSYNYFGASGYPLTAGTSKVFEGTISGYNTTSTGDPSKFDPEAKYFDLVLIANYGSTGTGACETVLEWLELTRLPNYAMIGKPSNQSVSTIKGVIAEVDTRSIVVTRDATGKVQKVEEKDGSIIVSTTTVARNTLGQITSITEVLGGNTITTTINRNLSGKITSTTKTVS
ncbi:hypothetical protein [Paenibacillus hexagrammi]|uniref:Uncharacterized protein n=1 Tax=Paenibacillus hexagrammi TaxID=2908839 RepID=A0ABY3SRD8_9BACL|nr:hypothetical protein [Paenibacillus sp. YPD9-1]UJF36623.1 hypothetical protein L0M14_30505 [Paenibacillus sp. YPD9-1]